MDNAKDSIVLAEGSDWITINQLSLRSRSLYRQLNALDEGKRPAFMVDALALGAELLERAGRHGDLEAFSSAIERLDEEAKQIVVNSADQIDRSIEKSMAEMTASMQSENGPFAGVVRQFDLKADGNVIDLLRDLVGRTATNATKQAVKDLSEATQETVERLTKSVLILETAAAAEHARVAEAHRGTAKGHDHEAATETLLGELVGVGGDSLDDVSTVVGQAGTKKGDKTITPRRGVTIVTEEKCTARISESKARIILQEAMLNRAAPLGMLIVDDEAKVPGNQPFHFIDDDKVVVVAERLALRMVYALFRAKSIQIAQAPSVTNDLLADSIVGIQQSVEDIQRAVERFRLMRTEHTKASKSIGQASRYLDEVAVTIGEAIDQMMATIDELVSDSESVVAA